MFTGRIATRRSDFVAVAYVTSTAYSSGALYSFTSMMPLLANNNQPPDCKHSTKSRGNRDLLLDAWLSATEAVARVSRELLATGVRAPARLDGSRGQAGSKSSEHDVSCECPM